MNRSSATAWLAEAATYFGKRPTGGEDMAYWANVSNAEACRKIAALLESDTTERPDLTQGDLQSELDTRTRERDEARAECDAWQRAADGRLGGVKDIATDALNRQHAAEALLKEAGQVLEPFANCGECWPGYSGICAYVSTADFRSAANLHARIVEQGSSVADIGGSPALPAKSDGLSPSEGGR